MECDTERYFLSSDTCLWFNTLCPEVTSTGDSNLQSKQRSCHEHNIVTKINILLQEIRDISKHKQDKQTFNGHKNCERASCYARANLPRTVPKSYWSWPVAICKGSVPTCTVVSPNTNGVHVPRRLYACLMKTEVPD